MFNKFLSTSFISASLLISTCGAMDVQDAPSLTLSTKKLQKGYTLGLTDQPLELKDGTKWLVTNKHWGEPTFEYITPKQKFVGSYDQFQKAFSFDYEIPGGPAYKWDDEKKEPVIDLENSMPDMHFFHLNVKQIMEEKALVLKIEEKAPQQFLMLNGMQIPCVWTPETNKLELDINSLPQLASMLNANFNPSQQNNSSTLAIEDKPSELKIEENKKDEVIEQNIPVNIQPVKDEVIEQNIPVDIQPVKNEVITSLSLTLQNLEIGYNTGTLTLEDGTRWTVTNLSPWSQPMFIESYMPTFEGYYNQYEDQFHFSHWSAGCTVIVKRWNKEKQIEEEVEEIDPGMEYFNLTVKRAK